MMRSHKNRGLGGLDDDQFDAISQAALDRAGCDETGATQFDEGDTSMMRPIVTLLCGCLVVGVFAGRTASAQDGHGSIIGWGSQVVGADLSADFVAVAAGARHSLGLKADGSIVAWGWNNYGQCDVPAPNTDFVAVAAGVWHSLGLKSDGY